VSEPTWLAVQIAVTRRPGLTFSDRFEALNNGMPSTTQQLTASFDGRQHLIHAEPGGLVITYDAALSRSAPAAVEPVTQLQRIVACARAGTARQTGWSASPAATSVDCRAEPMGCARSARTPGSTSGTRPTRAARIPTPWTPG
jgi:hypothetical protein